MGNNTKVKNIIVQKLEINFILIKFGL
jgi:hypothetical protein